MAVSGDDANTLDASAYCRAIESHLTQVSGGHLIRIVGPAFEMVLGWEAKGVPLKIVLRGIDRYVERYYAKTTRRRPVNLQFCEADVLDVFDEWRRAVGVPAAGLRSGLRSGGSSDPPDEGDAGVRRHGSLPAHLERVIARLTALRASATGWRPLAGGPSLDDVVRELDGARAAAKGLRGEARETLLDRLRTLDRTLLDAARAQLGALLADLERDADAELAPFRDRMPAEAYARSREACIDRLVRERAKLPVVTFE